MLAGIIRITIWIFSINGGAKAFKTRSWVTWVSNTFLSTSRDIRSDRCHDHVRHLSP